MRSDQCPTGSASSYSGGVAETSFTMWLLVRPFLEKISLYQAERENVGEACQWLQGAEKDFVLTAGSRKLQDADQSDPIAVVNQSRSSPLFEVPLAVFALENPLRLVIMLALPLFSHLSTFSLLRRPASKSLEVHAFSIKNGRRLTASGAGHPATTNIDDTATRLYYNV